MASSNTIENTSQNKTCGCAEGDGKNIWTTKTSENSDKQPQECPNCQILKSGTLFLSSKGIGWTSWKKRWFVLTRTSLVFYRSDPNALPQKGNEANPTLGGIDLNSSGSVVVKADKKLLTVLFPDGRDGRTFTLKAETSEELQEWKTALENALTQAPSAALVTSHSGILRNETADSVEASLEQLAEKDKRPVSSMVIGRPVLLALEEIDGSPSFLEKALRFIEDYGIKVEGILRQSADVEEVKRRVQEYEQGKDEFSSDEDAHVIGDCIKYVLRELPSSPVPASCCTALVEAYRTGRTNRLNAICSTISETFPEPNRRLLQRVLKMMRTVACHKVDNRMSLSALAACMAPLLLRPLLAGDCEVEDASDMSGDGSIQLLKAAAAANHAQAIIIILLEDYDRIFDDDSLSSEIYTESEELDEDEEEDGDYDDDDEVDIEDDFSTDNDILEGNGSQYSENGLETDIDDDFEGSSSGTLSRSISDVGSIVSDDKSTEDQSTDSLSPRDTGVVEATERHSSSMHTSTLGKDMTENLSTNATITQNADLKDNVLPKENAIPTSLPTQEDKSIGDVGTPASPLPKSGRHNKHTSTAKCPDISIESMSSTRRTTRLGRTPAKKNVPMGSTDLSSDVEVAIQSLETAKNELEAQITVEVKGNALLQASVERRKETLHERRSTLEKEVERLQELLQKERDLRAALESGLTNVQSGRLPLSCTMNSKTRADLEEINLAEADIISLKQKVADLREQLNHHPLCESCNQRLYAVQQTEEKDQQKSAHSSSLHQSINSLKKDDSLSQAENEDAKVRSQHSLSSRSIRHRKQKLSSKSQKRKMSGESSSTPCTEEPTSVVKNSASDVSTLRVENSMSGEDHENAKARTQDSHLSAAKQTSQNLLPRETPATVASDSSKKSTSRDENTKSGAETRNLKGQDQKSVTTADAQSSSKSSQSHNPPPSTEERTTLNCVSAPKKSRAKDENAKETSLSLEKGEPSQKLQQSSSVINSTAKSAELSEDATAGSNTASKMPLKSEETATSSSTALARLTSRLNFLKERRLQLVSELQNLDSGRASGQDPPPKTSST